MPSGSRLETSSNALDHLPTTQADRDIARLRSEVDSLKNEVASLKNTVATQGNLIRTLLQQLTSPSA